MSLNTCKACGKIFNGPGFRGMCRDCLARLENLYQHSRISDYIRRNINDKDFNPEEAARDLRMNPRDVRLLYDNGFLERDIQVYSRTPSQHQRLAEEIQRELAHKPINTSSRNLPPPPPANLTRSKTMTYGGRKYRRNNEW